MSLNLLLSCEHVTETMCCQNDKIPSLIGIDTEKQAKRGVQNLDFAAKFMISQHGGLRHLLSLVGFADSKIKILHS